MDRSISRISKYISITQFASESQNQKSRTMNSPLQLNLVQFIFLFYGAQKTLKAQLLFRYMCLYCKCLHFKQEPKIKPSQWTLFIELKSSRDDKMNLFMFEVVLFLLSIHVSVEQLIKASILRQKKFVKRIAKERKRVPNQGSWCINGCLLFFWER